jgi:hypothetical protein
MKGIALAAMLACVGCASMTHDLAEDKATWDNATYDEVVARWGQPVSGSARADGAEGRTWVSESVPYQSGPSVGFGVFGGGRGSGAGIGVNVPFGSPPAPLRCERTLYFRDGRVIDQQWTGPADFCAGFRRS